MTKQKSAVTSVDVARLAGLSQSAVSRTFTPGASVSAKTRETVLAAARELGYRPNALARSFIKQKSKMVGIVSGLAGYMVHPLFSKILEMLSSNLAESQLRTLVYTTADPKSVDEFVSDMLSYQVTAIIAVSVDISAKLAAECARAGIPVIYLTHVHKGKSKVIELLGDNEAGGGAIAEHFVKTGRTCCTFMAGYEGSPSSDARERGFMNYFERCGLPKPARIVGHATYDGAARAIEHHFENPKLRPDALFCAHDLMALSAIVTLREKFGLEAGKDCAVAGFDNIDTASWPCFSLTTYSLPITAIVDEATRIITASDPPKKGVRRIMSGCLIIRNSA